MESDEFLSRVRKWRDWFVLTYQREPNLPASAKDAMSRDAWLAAYREGFKAGEERQKVKPRPQGFKPMVIEFPKN